MTLNPYHVVCVYSDIFSLGFGPFRWVCASGDPADLAVTDNIALHEIEKLIKNGGMVLSRHCSVVPYAGML